jgi:hypothetical protein
MVEANATFTTGRPDPSNWQWNRYVNFLEASESIGKRLQFDCTTARSTAEKSVI